MLSKQSSLIDDLRNRRYKDAETASKDLIRANPLEAQSWVFLGEALMHQGYGDAANKVFQRAWLLDPEATWVAPILHTLKSVPLGDERVDIEGLLRVRKVTITAGIISCNMEDTIVRCLESLQGAVDHIVLLDCSTDRTAELASQFANVRVIPFVWEDDFAAARNKGLTHMTTDWVFWMDADEFLIKEDVDTIREVAGLYHDSPLPVILSLWQINFIQGQLKHNFAQTRIFPLRRGLRYWGRVHEQVGTELGLYHAEASRHKVKVRVFHDGYEPEIMASKGKIERNLSLLRMMIQEEPGNPAWWFYQGRELLGAGQKEEAVKSLIEAERKAGTQPLFGRLLEIYKFLIDIYFLRRDWKKAELYCKKALDYQSDFPDAHYMLAQVRMKQADQLYKDAEIGLQQAKEAFHSFRSIVAPDHEIAEWKSDAGLGDIAFRSGKLAMARNCYSNVRRKNNASLTNVISKKLAAIEAERQRLNQQSE
jgi:glycosyltransferase involved in cell wall biosynthesis